MALRASLPSGTVTLLFTDIEGSTQHWEQQRAAMSEALHRHDTLLRTAIESHGGYVFNTIGDQFCAAFSRASDALAAAADAQRALAAEDWAAVGGLAVRMALHSGATHERAGDYVGPVVNRVARLLEVVHGGQTVLSDVTALHLRGLMPEQMDLLDLGEHRLKDLIGPEHVWQLVAPGLPDTFPPLQSLGSFPNNLPRQVTPLICRDEVLAEIEPLVLECPLVTLVGTGGVGKTRLALQAGADLLDGSADGVWFLELAPLSDPALVVNIIASTFGLREQANRSMLDVVVQYLRSRRLLLILDNCEHLIEETARIAEAILRAAPHVRMLATSREPLRIAGEHVYHVPSLAVPSGDSMASEEALSYGAIALFAERAAASDGKFALTEENTPIVAEICRRLDGIALAIELAAARVKVLPPRQLAQKLDERFRVLTGGSRTALPRQQTMRALIDWSYDLLAEPEQRLFRRLAIFAGGWTLEAAEAVCTDETLDVLDLIDVLSSLVDKSLVVVHLAENRRYGLLESTRAFALEKLLESEECEALARRHAQWAAELADRAHAARWSTGATSLWHAEFEPEFENVLSAIEWALSHDEVALAARAVVGFSTIYVSLGPYAKLRGWLEAVLARLDAGTQPALAARAWRAL
ncbi:MAG: adenylate/guanylate cyclase domain-containing protein, partial [Candidatus Eremiobacteraeota bacterium]|nr:adenylate/guanylate cyclase domain-containing protein [Candidatus Eremiobacteraeota bacterium]